MTKHESLQWFEPMFSVPFLGLSQLTPPKRGKGGDPRVIKHGWAAKSICGTALVKVSDI